MIPWNRPVRTGLVLVATALASFAQKVPGDLEYLWPSTWVPEFEVAVERGEVADPTTRPLPPLAPRQLGTSSGGPPCITREHIFAFEDTNQVLLTNFSNAQLFQLMTDAANALMAVHGDSYDFIGYFLNFDADHTIGAAFYLPIENDVSGIGDPSGAGTPLFNARPMLGLNGQNVEGWIMMWNVNSPFWSPGSGPAAAFTRLALAQEFEHRWAMFLPNLLDGRQLQGNNGNCGRSAHWNWKVDGQGSGMEIAEWVGANPAVPAATFVSFNTDIPAGVFSYSDLYLMGYVTPAEMDAGNSELRYMDTSNCSSNYSGNVSAFSSADIVASAGTRVPGSASSQHDFRTAWVMFHLPGAQPSIPELDRAVGILEQHMLDWNHSTLGRGVMDDTLFDDCNCNGVPDAMDVAGGGGSTDVNGNGVPDECEGPVTYCTGKLNSAGCVPFVSSAGVPSATDPNPFDVSAEDLVPNEIALAIYGRKASGLPFHGGTLCVKTPFTRLLPPGGAGSSGTPPCSGRATRDFNKRIQSGVDPSLTVGRQVNLQFRQRDPTDPAGFGDGLTNGLQFVVEP